MKIKWKTQNQRQSERTKKFTQTFQIRNLQNGNTIFQTNHTHTHKFNCLKNFQKKSFLYYLGKC